MSDNSSADDEYDTDGFGLFNSSTLETDPICSSTGSLSDDSSSGGQHHSTAPSTPCQLHQFQSTFGDVPSIVAEPDLESNATGIPGDVQSVSPENQSVYAAVEETSSNVTEAVSETNATGDHRWSVEVVDALKRMQTHFEPWPDNASVKKRELMLMELSLYYTMQYERLFGRGRAVDDLCELLERDYGLHLQRGNVMKMRAHRLKAKISVGKMTWGGMKPMGPAEIAAKGMLAEPADNAVMCPYRQLLAFAHLPASGNREKPEHGLVGVNAERSIDFGVYYKVGSSAKSALSARPVGTDGGCGDKGGNGSGGGSDKEKGNDTDATPGSKHPSIAKPTKKRGGSGSSSVTKEARRHTEYSALSAFPLLNWMSQFSAPASDGALFSGAPSTLRRLGPLDEASPSDAVDTTAAKKKPAASSFAAPPRLLWKVVSLPQLIFVVAFILFAVFGNYMYFAPVRDSAVAYVRGVATRFLQTGDAQVAAVRVEHSFRPLNHTLDMYLRDAANSTEPSLRQQSQATVGRVWYEVDEQVLSSGSRTWCDAAWGLLRPALSAVAGANETMLADEAVKSAVYEVNGKVVDRLEVSLPPVKVNGMLEDLLQAKVVAAVGPLKWEQLRNAFDDRRCAELLPDPKGLNEKIIRAIETATAALERMYRLHPNQHLLPDIINATVHAQFSDFCPQNLVQTHASATFGQPGVHVNRNLSTDDLPITEVAVDGSMVENRTERAIADVPAGGVSNNTDSRDAERLRGAALKRAKAGIAASAAELPRIFAPVVHDPFSPSSLRSARKLQEWRPDWVETAIGRIERGDMDKGVWKDFLDIVKKEGDAVFDDIENSIKDRKVEITMKEEKAKEEAWSAMSTARSNQKLDGTPAVVDQALATTLRIVLQNFRSAAVINDVEPSPSYARMLDQLKEHATALWKSAHTENTAVHAIKKQELQAKAAATVTERIAHGVHTCSNTHHDHIFDLASRLPQYFGPQARVNLYSVKSRLDGSGGGEGWFNLHPGAGEHLVSTGGIGGRKYNGNSVYYNPGNAVLKVHLEGGGWGGGVCTNALWMSYVDLTITRNALALPENAVYNQPYNRGETPGF